MAINFENPLTAGTVLVRSDIRSQNFQPGVAGWRTEADGDAEFNNVIIRGATTTGGATLYYNGTPGLHTLIMSVAQEDGTDEYGNNYLAGIATYKADGITTYHQDLLGDVLIGAGDLSASGQFNFNPGNATLTSNDNRNSNGQWDAANSLFRMLFNNGTLSSFAQLQISDQPRANDASACLYLGSLETAGEFPAASDIASAGFIQVYSGLEFSSDYQMNIGSPIDRSDTTSSPAVITLGPGRDNVAYSGQVSFSQGQPDGSDTSQPLIVSVDGTVQQSTLYEDVVTIPGQSGGGTTHLVISGLNLVNGPTGTWMCLATANSSVPGTDVKELTYGSASATGVTLRINRTTNTNTGVSVMLKGL